MVTRTPDPPFDVMMVIGGGMNTQFNIIGLGEIRLTTGWELCDITKCIDVVLSCIHEVTSTTTFLCCSSNGVMKHHDDDPR